jgi:hypothetical protein
MNKQQASVEYFKKGASVISDLNIDQMDAALAEYLEKGVYNWRVGELGFNQIGKRGTRYYELKDALKDSFHDDPKAQALLEKMMKVYERDIKEIVTAKQPTREERAARKAEVVEILTKIEGLTDAEKQRLIKAV